MYGLKPLKHGSKQRKQNRGFSLVEVLVSIFILALIVAPILGNIAQATRINQTSRKMQNASNLGQNMMEGLKSQESFVEVAKQLIYKNHGVPFDLFSLADIGSIVTDQIELDAATNTYIPVADKCITRLLDPVTSDYTYSLKENASGVYQFQASNITYNGSKYCAKIEYNSSAYNKTKPEDPDKYNDVDIPILPSVSDDKNAVVTLTYQDDWAKSTLKQQYNVYFNSTFNEDNTVTNTEIGKDMKRLLKLEINYDATKGKYIVKGTFTYTLSSLIPSGGEYKDVFYLQEFNQLENVYLFFPPNLNLKGDEIEVDNNLTGDAADLNLYLVEQLDNELVESGQYKHLMNLYWLTVNLTEAQPPLDPTTNEYIYHTKIRTNLGSTILDFDGKSRIIYPNILVNKLNQQVLIDRDTDKTRIYNITIELYQEPEAGTAMFKPEDYITTFTSSKGE